MAVDMFGVLSTVGGSCPECVWHCSKVCDVVGSCALCGWCELPRSGGCRAHSASAGGHRDCGGLKESAGIASDRGKRKNDRGTVRALAEPSGSTGGGKHGSLRVTCRVQGGGRMGEPGL